MLPLLETLGTFRVNSETKKVYHKLEEVISICLELRSNKMDSITLKTPNY